MTNIRRYFEEGQTCFLTHITHNRIPILVDHFDLLWPALKSARSRHGLILNAWSVIPDHIHMLVEVGETDVSATIRRFKLSFSTNLRTRLGMREGRIWQYRFYDRIMRDQEDLNTHVNYIHYNPVRHGLIDNPFEWKYSSAADYLKDGFYAADWGVREPIEFEGDFGE
jgi:putative transposase